MTAALGHYNPSSEANLRKVAEVAPAMIHKVQSEQMGIKSSVWLYHLCFNI